MGYMTPLYNWDRLGDIVQGTVNLFKRDIRAPNYDVRKEPQVFVERLRNHNERNLKKHIEEDEEVKMLKNRVERATKQKADFKLLEKVWRYKHELKTRDKLMIDVPVDIFDASSIAFNESIVKVPNGPLLEYLATTLNHTHFPQIKKQIEKIANTTLKDRGEAHMTIITPPEYGYEAENYQQGLGKLIKLPELNAIAQGERTREESAMQLFSVQQFDMYPLCIGKASRSIGKKGEKGYKEDSAVYYIIVESKQASAFREELETEFQARRGNPSHFCAKCFRAHITIGYEDNDWFEDKSIYKTEHTCEYGINLIGMINSDQSILRRN